MRRYIALVLFVFFAQAAFAAGDSFRCGSKIIKTGMTMADVLKYCGEPTNKEVEIHDVRSGNRVTGTTELHRWTYSRGSTGKPMVLEFDQDKLLYIRRQD